MAHFQKLEEYYNDLTSWFKSRNEEDECTIKALGVFIHYLHKNYKQTLLSIRNLLSDGEIMFDFFYALLIPGEVFIARCPLTNEPHAMRLLRWGTINEGQEGPMYILVLESLETSVWASGNNGPSHTGPAFGMLKRPYVIRSFQYVEKIHEQIIYPLKYDPNPEKLKAALLERGRKWANLNGVFHKEYRGAAVYPQVEESGASGRSRIRRRVVNTRSRVMIDEGRVCPLYK